MSVSIYGSADMALNNSFKESLALDVSEIARRLIGVLGGALVSTLAGAKDVKAAHGWAKKGGTVPRNAAEERLRFAYQQFQYLSAAEGENVAKVWFIGANPWLDYETPIMVIRDGRYKEASIAAQAVVEDSFNG